MFIFLLIISGFWFMFMQLWDLLPVFHRRVGRHPRRGRVLQLGAEPAQLHRRLKPEMIVNINPATIILLCLPIAWLFARFKMITALMLGMIIGTVGFVGTGISMSGGFVAMAIFLFSLGEVICSPKFTEYIGMSAPPDKKALYMGYSNIPFAIGWAGGNFLSGPLYGVMSDRTTFASRYLQNEMNVDKATLDTLVVTKGKAKGKPDAKLMLQHIAKLKGLQGADSAATDKKAYAEAQWGATRLLWAKYNPWYIWLVLGAIGLASIIGMALFYRGKKDGPTDQAESATIADEASSPVSDKDGEER
jgi:hypothetical protein